MESLFIPLSDYVYIVNKKKTIMAGPGSLLRLF